MKYVDVAVPKLTTVTRTDVLHALGLERRRSPRSKAVAALGLTALGALLGAGLVLTRALMLGAHAAHVVSPERTAA